MSTNRAKIIQLHSKPIIISNTNVHTVLNGSANFQDRNVSNIICPLTDFNEEMVTSDAYGDLRTVAFAEVKNSTAQRLKRISTHLIKTDNCIASTFGSVPQPNNSTMKKLSHLHVARLGAIESENIYINSKSMQSEPSEFITNIATPVKITSLGPSTVLVSEYLDNGNEIKNSTFVNKPAQKAKSNCSAKKSSKKRARRDDHESLQLVDKNSNAIPVYTDTVGQPIKQPRFDLADMSIDMCRICTRKESLVSIFDTAQSPTIIERIKSLANVQIYMGDGLPQMICKQCIYKLSTAYNFKKLCEFSDLEMRRKTTIKEARQKITDPILNTNNAKRIEEQIDEGTCDEVELPEYEQAIDNSDLDFQPPLANDSVEESENERSEECVTCKSKFKNPIELQKHIITTHLVAASSPPEDNFHICTVCKKVFNSLHKLNAHAVYHNKVKYRCDLCPMTFCGLVNYKRHQKMCHPLQCGECNLTFEYEYFLEQHTRLEHKQLDVLFKYVAPVTSTHWSDSDSD